MSIIDDHPKAFSLTEWAPGTWALEIHVRDLGGPLTSTSKQLLENVAGALVPVLREHDRRQAVAAAVRRR